MEFVAAQCRAGRALLDWSQDQLAENAQVARATIADFERESRLPMRQNLVAIIAALEAAGLQFIPENGGGAGVRFRKVELQYSNAVSPDGDGVSLSVRFRETDYRAAISREVLDDLDRTNYRTFETRVLAVQNHLPLLLRAIEDKLAQGDVGRTRRIVIDHKALPDDAF
jgi:transcriptional regulator with XRE-family HTH domain